jgi:hypothetical protein
MVTRESETSTDDLADAEPRVQLDAEECRHASALNVQVLSVSPQVLHLVKLLPECFVATRKAARSTCQLEIYNIIFQGAVQGRRIRRCEAATSLQLQYRRNTVHKYCSCSTSEKKLLRQYFSIDTTVLLQPCSFNLKTLYTSAVTLMHPIPVMGHKSM